MKFIDSWTNDEKISCVTVKYRNNYYEGRAYLHPEDDWSEFTGCRYAHERAEIAALKDEWKEKKAACEECRKFVNMVTQYKNFDKDSPTAKAMFRQLNRRIKEVNTLANIISKRQFNLNVMMRQQDEFKNKIKQNKSINNKEN